MITNQIVCVLL